MSSLIAILLYILILISILYYGVVLYTKKARTVVLPPGPWGIPLLGNLHQITKNAPLKLSQWAKEYGKLYTIHFGNKPTLVVNDAALMKQLFSMSASTGKFSSDLFDVAYQGPYGLGNTEGPIWQEQRTYFSKSLRNVGFNKTAQMTPIILEEIENLIDWINTEMNVEGTVNFSERLKMTSGNIMWSVAVGERKETTIGELIEEFTMRLNSATNSGLAFFSWLRYIAPKATGYTAFDEISRRIHEFVRKYFNDPLRINGDHDDMISAYINHVKSTTDKKSSFYGGEGLKHSLSSVVGLLIAGTETTSTTINWLIFYLAVNPDVQSKMQREIDEVIGEDRDPTLEDRKWMPYMQAVIEETLRMSSAIPFGIIQVLQEDVAFLEYRLPKGLHLLANIYHVHNDSKVWGDPENFRPERFLDTKSDSKGRKCYSVKVYVKENVVSFQPGRRTCPGDFLARDVIFLSATKLLKIFWFSPELGRSREEYVKPNFGYVLIPQKIGVLVKERRVYGN